MKKLILRLLCFLGCGLMMRAQAPQSLAGYTMYGNFSPYDPWSSVAQKVVEFFGDGTFALRLSASQQVMFPTKNVYSTPVTGTYQYHVTSPTTAILNCDPPAVGRDLTLITFSNDSAGAITPSYSPIPGQGATFYFHLGPTGGVSLQRALVNVSVLVTAKRGEVPIIGFVVGGAAPSREVLIRAVGPGLAPFGVPGYAPNPTYRLNPAPRIIDYDSSWSATPASEATIAAEGARAGAFELTPGSNDKADLFLLPPGAYTITAGATTSDQEGRVLIEVYEIQ